MLATKCEKQHQSPMAGAGMEGQSSRPLPRQITGPAAFAQDSNGTAAESTYPQSGAPLNSHAT